MLFMFDEKETNQFHAESLGFHFSLLLYEMVQ